MSDTTKVSFSLDNELLREVTKLTKTPPKQNQTQVLNNLIYKGLNLEQEVEKLRNREEYILFKLLYMMRVLASSRGDEFLEEIDQRFQSDLAEMREMILEEGMDFTNGRL